jgi:hypothetical protein
MDIVSVVGIDPGPSTGISFMDYVGSRLAGSMQLQVDAKSAVLVLETILVAHYPVTAANIVRRQGEVEAFVTGRSAGSKGEDAEITRQLAFQLLETLQLYGYATKLRKAGDIKTWASDKRLAKLGIFRENTGMRHANDASRHGLYTAVHDIYMEDPLR